MKKIYNFSPGPAMLPKKILRLAKKTFYNWNNTGISFLELHHRNEHFIKIIKKIKFNLKYLLSIPKNYEILFCHGGARGQFSALPLNLFKKDEKVDYIISGYWSKLAAKEAKKYCLVKEINVRLKNKNNISTIPMKYWKLNKNSKYLHYCPNETADGLAIYSNPKNIKRKIILADFSSIILSRVIDIKNYGLIYASSQKNLGISGFALVIIREDLLNQAKKKIPSILDYNILKKTNSLYNTPCTFSFHITEMILEWLKEKGGIIKIEKQNKKKAKILYKTIDNSSFYLNNINPINRSMTNIYFKIQKEELNHKFIYQAEKEGLLFLKGHIAIGGLRASIYNAMPIKGVKKLNEFMIQFEKNNRKF